MNDTFGDDIYLPLNERLCRFSRETGDENNSDYTHNKMQIFTFYDSNNPCELCKDTLIALNAWIYDNAFMRNNRVTWVIEPFMRNNLICKDIGITVGPTTLFCDKDGNIFDIITGRPSEHWLNKNLMPIMES